MAHIDYSMTLPWPEVSGHTISRSQGYRTDFIEPGRKARVTYRSADGRNPSDHRSRVVVDLRVAHPRRFAYVLDRGLGDPVLVQQPRGSLEDPGAGLAALRGELTGASGGDGGVVQAW
jgi:hypothetical protein